MRDIILYLLVTGSAIIDSISYIPQIIKLIKTKKSEGIAVSSWTLWCLGETLNMTYAIVLGRCELLIYSALILSMNMAVIVLSIKYARKDTV